MMVIVNGSTGEVQLVEPENLRGLSVELHGCDVAGAAELLGELGRVEGSHVWLDIARLRALSPLANDAEWLAGFTATMAYAKTSGWVDEAGTRVRAHLAHSS